MFAICRTKSDALTKTSAIIIEGVDMKHPESFSNLQPYLDANSIDVFIQNAAISRAETMRGGTQHATESVRKQFNVNALGPYALTEYIYAYLKAGVKLVFVTSRIFCTEPAA